jgi:succinyl-diaminopimelate desuccinylase
MPEVLELAKSLIARPSVTPDDAGCQELIGQRLARFGFRQERFDRGATTNRWLRRGERPPVFAFLGHTDVVPPGPREQWSSDPFTPVERDGRLYGRGSADMKSSIAAFVVAVEQLLTRHPTLAGSIAVLLTSDEEGPATDGTVAVIDALAARGESIDYGLVGEPTCEQRLGDTVKNGRRGSLSGRMVVRGIQGHVAYPQLARNPVHALAPAMTELVSANWDQGDDDFLPTSFQISNIRAGVGAGNVIPGHCEVDFNFRFAACSPPDDLRRRVSAMLDRYGVDYRVEWTLGAEPYVSARGRLVDALTQSIREITGCSARLSTSGGTSDGRFVSRICPQVVEFGPPNATIHQADECVSVLDLEPLMRIYRGALERLLLPGPSRE